MQQTVFPVRSVTNAMRGKSLLEKRGFKVYVQRSFKTDENNGCGYRLLVNGNGDQAQKILESAGLFFGGRAV